MKIKFLIGAIASLFFLMISVPSQGATRKKVSKRTEQQAMMNAIDKHYSPLFPLKAAQEIKWITSMKPRIDVHQAKYLATSTWPLDDLIFEYYDKELERAYSDPGVMAAMRACSWNRGKAAMAQNAYYNSNLRERFSDKRPLMREFQAWLDMAEILLDFTTATLCQPWTGTMSGGYISDFYFDMSRAYTMVKFPEFLSESHGHSDQNEVDTSANRLYESCNNMVNSFEREGNELEMTTDLSESRRLLKKLRPAITKWVNARSELYPNDDGTHRYFTQRMLNELANQIESLTKDCS